MRNALKEQKNRKKAAAYLHKNGQDGVHSQFF